MKEELERKLYEIQEHLFIIDMVDRWQKEELDAWNFWQKEKAETEKKLEEIENEGKQ